MTRLTTPHVGVPALPLLMSGHQCHQAAIRPHRCEPKGSVARATCQAPSNRHPWSGYWGGLGLLGIVTLLVWGTAWAQQEAPGPPPPPGPVPPNASHITATVLSHSLWPPGSLRDALPPVPPEQTLYSLRVAIYTVKPESAQLDSLAQPGSIVEVFSAELLPSELVGKQIRATLTLTGDTRGRRWWVSNIHVLP